QQAALSVELPRAFQLCQQRNYSADWRVEHPGDPCRCGVLAQRSGRMTHFREGQEIFVSLLFQLPIEPCGSRQRLQRLNLRAELLIEVARLPALAGGGSYLQEELQQVLRSRFAAQRTGEQSECFRGLTGGRKLLAIAPAGV